MTKLTPDSNEPLRPTWLHEKSVSLVTGESFTQVALAGVVYSCLRTQDLRFPSKVSHSRPHHQFLMISPV